MQRLMIRLQFRGFIMKRFLVFLFMLSLIAPAWSAETVRYNKNMVFNRAMMGMSDSTYVDLPDSTFAQAAYKVVYVDLHNQSQMWDLVAFDNLSKNTSWYKELGRFPRRSMIMVTSGQDSVVVWNMDTAEEWIVFADGGSGGSNANMLGGSSNVSDVFFLDGVLWASRAAAWGLLRIDFVRDGALQWIPQQSIVNGDITGRNGGNGYFDAGTPAIVNNTVNTVVAIRDPKGSVDDSGRPQQIFSAGTDGGESRSDAGIENIYDASAITDIDGIAFLPEGDIFKVDESATRESVTWSSSAQSISADGFGVDETWINTGSGGEDIPFTNATTFADIAAFPSLSVSGNGSPLVVVATDQGVLISHAKRNDNTNSLTFVVDGSGNWPPYSGSGTKMRSWHMGSVNELFNNDLTNNNTVTFVDGKVGKAANFVAASSQSLSEADGADYTFTTAFSAGLWFRREVDSGGAEGLMAKYDEVDVNDQSFYLAVTSTDLFSAGIITAGPIALNSFSTAISLNVWYHGVVTYNGANITLYLDGEQVDQDAQTGNMIDGTEPVQIGAWGNGGSADNFFDGQIDDAFVMDRVLSADEVRLLYQRGLQAVGTAADYLTGSTMLALGADEKSGQVAVVMNTTHDSVFVLDARTAIPRHGSAAASNGGVINDAAIFTLAGQDTTGLVIGDATDVKWVQGKVVLREAGKDQQIEIVAKRARIGHFFGPSNLHLFDAVVDSAGHGNYTQVDEAIDAGALSIFIKNGTYSPFDADVAGLHIVGVSRDLVIIDGGTTGDAIDVSADVYLAHLTARTTAGQGNAYDVLHVSSGIARVYDVHLDASDDDLVEVGSGATVIIHDSEFGGCDDDGFSVLGVVVVQGNLFNNDIGGIAINLGGTADNSQMNDNRGLGAGTFISIDVNAENCVAVGNITDGTISDASGTSTVANNEAY